MGFGGEDSKSRTLALGMDLVVSELLNELGPGYHCSDRRYSCPTFNRTAKYTEISETRSTISEPGVPVSDEPNTTELLFEAEHNCKKEILIPEILG